MMNITTETTKTQANTKVTLKDKQAWIIRLYADKHMSTSAKLVGARLALYHHEASGRCNPRQQTIADAVNLERRTVNRVLRELEQAGWIGSKQTRGASHYTIIVSPADAAEASKESLYSDTSEDDVEPKESPLSDTRSRGGATAGVAVERQQVSRRSLTEPCLEQSSRTTLLNQAPGGEQQPANDDVPADAKQTFAGWTGEGGFGGVMLSLTPARLDRLCSVFPSLDVPAYLPWIDDLATVELQGCETNSSRVLSFVCGRLEQAERDNQAKAS